MTSGNLGLIKKGAEFQPSCIDALSLRLNVPLGCIPYLIPVRFLQLVRSCLLPKPSHTSRQKDPTLSWPFSTCRKQTLQGTKDALPALYTATGLLKCW